MSKFFVGLICFGLCVSIFANAPGYTTVEAQKMKTILEDSSAPAYRKCFAQVRQTAGVITQAKTCQEIETLVTPIYTKYKMSVDYSHISGLAMWYWPQTTNTYANVLAYCKLHNCYEQPAWIAIHKPLAFNSTEQRALALSNFILNKTNYSPLFVKAVDAYLELVPDLDETTAKTTLKKMNRKFSPKLLTDKTNYEPIIAKIRTSLDTF